MQICVSSYLMFVIDTADYPNLCMRLPPMGCTTSFKTAAGPGGLLWLLTTAFCFFFWPALNLYTTLIFQENQAMIEILTCLDIWLLSYFLLLLSTRLIFRSGFIIWLIWVMLCCFVVLYTHTRQFVLWPTNPVCFTSLSCLSMVHFLGPGTVERGASAQYGCSCTRLSFMSTLHTHACGCEAWTWRIITEYCTTLHNQVTQECERAISDQNNMKKTHNLSHAPCVVIHWAPLQILGLANWHTACFGLSLLSLLCKWWVWILVENTLCRKQSNLYNLWSDGLIQTHVIAFLYPTATIMDTELMSSVFWLITLVFPKSCLIVLLCKHVCCLSRVIQHMRPLHAYSLS